MSIKLKDTASITAQNATSATSATKATQDSAGQQINTTYIKGLSVSGKTITYTKGDGSTGTITTQDTNTTYSAATQSAAGLMSAADKKKLDGVATSANNYSHPNSGVAASSYGPSANASPAHGKTFSVPYITVNAAGHITAASTKTITLPADNNTWRGVQNNLTSTATDQSLSAAQGKILQDNKADKTLLGEDLASKTISLNDLNLSSGNPKFKVYYCPTDGGGSNITGRPNDSSKQAFNLIVESLRWASTTDYITKQTYTQGAQKIIYVRYCTNGTWSAWEKVYTSGQKPTAADIGAAKASHGTHLTIGTGASNAAAGNHTHSGYASSNHTHSGYASSSHIHTNIDRLDTRDVNTTPDGAPVGLSVHLKNNGKDGLSDGGTYHSSLFIKGWDDYSGGPYGNIAISENNNLWFRSSSSGTAWNSWKRVSVYGHTHAKLSTARTLTIGATGKTFDGSDNVSWSLQDIMKGQGLNAGTASGTLYYNNAGKDHVGRLSCYNDANGDFVQVAIYNKSSSSVVSSLNMYANHARFNRYVIFNEYVRPNSNGSIDMGASNYRWRTVYSANGVSTTSDRTLKENIKYVRTGETEINYNDMYNFVKNDLELATYNYINSEERHINFIAQDLLANEDGTDNKVGQFIINPVPVPAKEDIENGEPYPLLSYNTNIYTSVLAGALKESIDKIEKLESEKAKMQSEIDELKADLTELKAIVKGLL